MMPIARRGTVIIEGTISAPVFNFIRECPGFTKWLNSSAKYPHGGVLFEASRFHIDLWRKMFPDVNIEDTDGTLTKLSTPLAPIVSHVWRTKAREPEAAHTIAGIDIALSRPYYAFFDDMGTRKTALMLRIAGELWAHKHIKRALIITRRRGIPQILTEQIPRHMSNQVRYRAGMLPDPRTVKKFLYPNGELLIGVTSPGSLQSEARTKDLIDFCSLGDTVIFVDESQDFKGYTTVRSKNLRKLGDLSTIVRKYILSGEPATLGYIDLFSQFYFLDPDIFGHSTLTSFKNYYAVLGGYQGYEVIDYRHKEELAATIAPHCRFISIKDCFDMPEQDWQESHFNPTSDQRTLYNRMRLDFIAEVHKAKESGDPEIIRRVCTNAATKYLALQQIACGFLRSNPDDDGNPGVTTIINDERAMHTVEIAVGAAKKCLVFCRFYEDLDAIARALKHYEIGGVEFSGRVSTVDGQDNKLRFINDPNCRVFYATAASGGTALDGLQVASRTVFYSNGFNWGDRGQAERRTWRSGQHNNCVYVDIIGFPIDRIIRANAIAKEDSAKMLRTLTGLAQLAEGV